MQKTPCWLTLTNLAHKPDTGHVDCFTTTATLAQLDTLQVNYREPGNDQAGLFGKFRQMLFNTLLDIYFWYSDR